MQSITEDTVVQFFLQVDSSVLKGVLDIDMCGQSLVDSCRDADTAFTFQLSSSPSSETLFLLYDALGREVKREAVTSQTTTLNRNNLPAGIYYWQLQSGGAAVGKGKVVFD